MSLTGTLLSGVAGLKAQTNAMAILSDNISNINTIGYKKSIATFSTLVVNSAASTTYSPGGVKSGRFALVDNQGVLQASNRPLDVAVSGNGFFAVNTDGTGFRVLRHFSFWDDGGRPQGGLTLVSNVLYGANYYGGTNTGGKIGRAHV